MRSWHSPSMLHALIFRKMVGWILWGNLNSGLPLELDDWIIIPPAVEGQDGGWIPLRWNSLEGFDHLLIACQQK